MILTLATAVLVSALGFAGPAKMGAGELDAWLKDLRASTPDFGERLAEVVRASLGTPYADGPLGEGPDGEYDTDPLIDLTRVDCVTFVEQSIALAAARRQEDVLPLLTDIRYRDGRVDYETRNHFFVADWLGNNTFCEDVTVDLGVPTAAVTRRISRGGFFQRVGAPALGGTTPDRDVTLRYVPTEWAAEAAWQLPSPSLVVFVGRVDWLFALHTGFYVRESGQSMLYHAGTQAGSVVAVPFVPYLEGMERYLGFVAYRVREPEL